MNIDAVIARDPEFRSITLRRWAAFGAYCDCKTRRVVYDHEPESVRQT